MSLSSCAHKIQKKRIYSAERVGVSERRECRVPDELCAANLRERDGGRVEVFARARLALRLRGEEERAEVDREVYCEERDRDRVGAGGWHCEVCVGGVGVRRARGG